MIQKRLFANTLPTASHSLNHVTAMIRTDRSRSIKVSVSSAPSISFLLHIFTIQGTQQPHQCKHNQKQLNYEIINSNYTEIESPQQRSPSRSFKMCTCISMWCGSCRIEVARVDVQLCPAGILIMQAGGTEWGLNCPGLHRRGAAMVPGSQRNGCWSCTRSRL